MDNSHLVKGHCVPCEGGTRPMEKEEIDVYLSLLKTPWEVRSIHAVSRYDRDPSAEPQDDTLAGSGLSIVKQFKFKDFKEAMEFVNKIAVVAEEQGHHPDMIVSYNKVLIQLTTHAIGGLSTNDFIVASKIETLV